MYYPVRADMLVYELRRELSKKFEELTVHLLVGPSWEYDILDHSGSITDRVFPFTGDLRPYLQNGWEVDVYFQRPIVYYQRPTPILTLTITLILTLTLTLTDIYSTI